MTLACPYCGESLEIEVDCSMNGQEFIEDCTVCCRPIRLQLAYNGEDIRLKALREDDC